MQRTLKQKLKKSHNGYTIVINHSSVDLTGSLFFNEAEFLYVCVVLLGNIFMFNYILN